MKVLVLGGEGMLGHKMYQTLLRHFPDTACTLYGRRTDPGYDRIDLFRQGTVFESVDAMALDALDRFLETHQPEVIVNCIGVIKQRDDAIKPLPSITLNSLLPHRLAAAASKWGGRVIHFSTDCVFSGKKGNYTEGDPSDAEDLYGKSKYLGETIGEENMLTLRTSIIGRELFQFRSLLEWFLAQRGKTIRGFRRVIYAGVTTNFMADVVADVIANHKNLSGLYQVTSPPISKYDLLTKINQAFDAGVTIEPDDQVVSDRSMVGTKFLKATGRQLPTWDALVEQLASDPTPYEQWR